MPGDFENEFNNAVKKAAGDEYKRVRKELLKANQNEAAEILGYDIRNYQRLESGKGTPNLSKHFANIFSLLRHYARGIGRGQAIKTSLVECHGETTNEQAEEFAEREARQVLSRLISPKQKGEQSDSSR